MSVGKMVRADIVRKEAPILREVLALSKAGVRLFRNTVGAAFIGPFVWADGAVIVTRPQRVQFGLCRGSSDVIGWRTVVITQDMVGQAMAQFVALEVKNDRGRVTAEQQAFIDHVNRCGGIGAVVRSADEAEGVLR